MAAVVLVVCCAHSSLGQRSSIHTFTSPDGTFAFEYHDPLISCRKIAGTWEPAESCTANAPTCGDSDVACVAYPLENVAGTNFVSGTFSVGQISGVRDQAACLNDMMAPDYPIPATRKIGGVNFKGVHHDGVGSGIAAGVYQYRAFHGGRCYDLKVQTASMNPNYADPGAIKRLPQSQRKEIDTSLERTLKSFRLK